MNRVCTWLMGALAVVALGLHFYALWTGGDAVAVAGTGFAAMGWAVAAYANEKGWM